MQINIAIAAIIIAIISATASGILCYFVWVQLRIARYTYLANKWYEIKEKEYINPEFIDITKTSTFKDSFKGDLLKKYETFAWICWGHAEDVYRNKWHKDPGFKSSFKQRKNLHYRWLKELENQKHFSSDFIKYIDAL